jgi:hypothetical protein
MDAHEYFKQIDYTEANKIDSSMIEGTYTIYEDLTKKMEFKTTLAES